MAATGGRVIDYLSVGSGNILYVFAGNNVTAINPGGEVKWTVNLPGYLASTI